MKNGYASPPSSPPTPPSPLPISVGPGQEKYLLSSSPSPSPPFSPPSSSPSSAENLPLLQEKSTSKDLPSVFSLDRPCPDEPVSRPSCLCDLLEWLLLRCCSWSLPNSHPYPPRGLTNILTSPPTQDCHLN